MKPTIFQTLARHMLCADGIIRAQRARPQRLHQMILKVPRLLHEPAQGPLPVTEDKTSMLLAFYC
jgi:hypothetical protein